MSQDKFRDPGGNKPYHLTQFISLVNSLNIPQSARNNMIRETTQMMGAEIEEWTETLKRHQEQDPNIIAMIGQEWQ
ncbi:MAG: hypothetical protein VX730_02865 [Pseudomonadota bacterium]|nr:hypothetical protein [Pseudomonadota bacterium]